MAPKKVRKASPKSKGGTAKPQITLTLPISIRPTATDEGFVIEDAEGVSHYFYYNKDKTLLEYDGDCRPITRIPKQGKVSDIRGIIGIFKDKFHYEDDSIFNLGLGNPGE